MPSRTWEVQAWLPQLETESQLETELAINGRLTQEMMTGRWTGIGPDKRFQCTYYWVENRLCLPELSLKCAFGVTWKLLNLKTVLASKTINSNHV